MHKHIFYDTISRDELQQEQLGRLLSFEQATENVKLATDCEGLRVDFNSGARVQVPQGNWHVRISDYDSGIVAFDDDVEDCTLVAAEKYFIRWQVEVWQDGEPVFEHVLDLAGQDVFIFMAGGALGDSISLFPYLRLMQQQHRCRICLFPPNDSFRAMLKEYFPDIRLVEKIPDSSYAAYCLAVFQMAPYLIATDSRMITPDMAARSILGLNANAARVIYYPTRLWEMKVKYGCIAVQASGVRELWHRDGGWGRVVAYLKKLGYRVLCIDGAAQVSFAGKLIEKPAGAEDFTGMRPLMERINLLAYADFFIGLGSGLSWLAQACDVPVILISGFSLPLGEFDTPYRVTNQNVCHGCYNDIRVEWKDGCPYHAGTEREFECSRAISYQMVKMAIDNLLAARSISEGDSVWNT